MRGEASLRNRVLDSVASGVAAAYAYRGAQDLRADIVQEAWAIGLEALLRYDGPEEEDTLRAFLWFRISRAVADFIVKIRRPLSSGCRPFRQIKNNPAIGQPTVPTHLVPEARDDNLPSARLDYVEMQRAMAKIAERIHAVVIEAISRSAAPLAEREATRAVIFKELKASAAAAAHGISVQDLYVSVELARRRIRRDDRLTQLQRIYTQELTC